MPKTSPTTDLRGYALVADRIALFYERFPAGQITTELVSRTHLETVVRACVYRSDADLRPSATGLAAEREGDGDINTVACLENTETSAIGRALANLGFLASTQRPSAEEIFKAGRARDRAASGAAADQWATRGASVDQRERAASGPAVDQWATRGASVDQRAQAAARVTGDQRAVMPVTQLQSAVRERPPVHPPHDGVLQAQADSLADCLELLGLAVRMGMPEAAATDVRRRLGGARSVAPSEIARIEHRLRDWITRQPPTPNDAPAAARSPEPPKGAEGAP